VDGHSVLILLVVFVPSMKLLAHQYKTPPANAITIKAIGNQWYWTYAYPDNGGFEVNSNMLPPPRRGNAASRPSLLPTTAWWCPRASRSGCRPLART
jgi:cytochrome c oxidase subunit 2